MKIHYARSSQDVEVFHDMRKQWRDQLKQGCFYAEGEQVFARLLESKLELVSVLLTQEFLEIHRKALENRSCSLTVADKSWIEANTNQKLNQGILALARIPPPFLTDTLHEQKQYCVVALNGIDHAVNVGTILRNCAAFGVSAVITDSRTVHPYCWRAVKASLGGVFQIPFLVTSDLSETLKLLREFGAALIAADPSSQFPLSEMQFPEKMCLILGNEHAGISSELLNLEPQKIAIPMSGKMDSLNVAAASAILLYEISRRVGYGI